MENRLKKLGATAIAVCVMTTTVWAHSGAMGVVKERMDAMLGMASALEKLAGLVEQRAPDPDEVVRAAAVFEQHSGDAMTALFPEGSLQAPSQATAVIWNEWPEFAALATELGRLAGYLKDAAARQGAEEPPLIAPVQTTARSSRPTWEDLDERALLGLKPDSRVSPRANDRPTLADAGPSVMDVYRGIVSNCAACHRQFRRERP